jgi:branched-chain amino acid transport system permease protein
VFDWLDRSQQFTLDVTLITTLLVISVHLVLRAGIFSVATMGFAAVGAYTTAILVTKDHWPTWTGLAAATALPALLAAVFAAPILRLRGIYLALGSLALAQVIIILISNMRITNGTLGFIGIPNDVSTISLMLIVAGVFILLQLDAHSHFGRAVKAVRLDERTADGLGVNVRRVRFNAFVASAAVAGLAGALEAHRTTVISPDQYSFGALIPLFTFALIGGNEHWAGPVLTCWTVTALRHWLGFIDSDWENIAYGVLLIAVVIVAPGGLTDPTLWRKLRRVPQRLTGWRAATTDTVAATTARAKS